MAPGLSSSPIRERNGAADDVGTLSKIGKEKNATKKMMQLAQGQCMFSTFYLDKMFLGIDFIETTRCSQGDALFMGT